MKNATLAVTKVARVSKSASLARNAVADITSSPAPAPAPRLLAAPITAATFWKNRRGDAICVRFGEYKGRAVVDLRVFYTGMDGKLHPTKKGIALKMSALPELAAAVNRAHLQARRLGLLGQPVGGKR